MRRRNLVPLALLLLPLFLSACKSKQESASPVLLRVDGHAITLDQFRNEFERTLPPGAFPTSDALRKMERAFLEQFIDRQLVLAEAGRLGVSLAPGETDAAFASHRGEYPTGALEEFLRRKGMTPELWRQEFDRRALVEKTVRQQVYAAIEVSDGEIERFYEQHRHEERRPAQVRLRQIVVAEEDEGKKALERLRRGEPFSEVARQLSLAPERHNGGDLGFFAKGEMPSVFDSAFLLPVGRLSDLVRSDYGYHIFVVEERRDAVALSLDDVREEIRAELRARKEEEAHRSWLQRLRNQASIEVNWSLLQGASPLEKKE